MPAQPAISGGRTFVGPSVGGGEGPWYYAQGAGTVCNVPDCVVGDTIVVWMLTGYGGVSFSNASVLIETSMGSGTTYMFYILIKCTTAGTVAIDSNYSCGYSAIIAHKTSSPAAHST